MFLHARYKLIENISVYFFPLVFSSFSRNSVSNVCKKTLSGFLCSSFIEGETKEAFCFSNVFCIRCISKTKRKPAKKSKQQCFPLNL